MFKPLSKRALNTVEEYDRTHWQTLRQDNGKPYANTTRFYSMLAGNRKDLECHTCAVKYDRKNKRTVVKEVMICSVNKDKIWLKDIVFMGMSGYGVDWSPEGLSPARTWTYDGQPDYDVYTEKSPLWKSIPSRIINWQYVATHREFKYCGWGLQTGRYSFVIDFLRAYKKHPKIELLAKNGLGRFALKHTFVRMMEKNKAFVKFVRDNMKEIADSDCQQSVVLYAFRHGCTLVDADRKLNAVVWARRLGGLCGVDAAKAYDYVKAMKIDPVRYQAYLRRCQFVDLDLNDTKNAFPKDFAARDAVVFELDWKKQESINKPMIAKKNKRIRTVANVCRPLSFKAHGFVVKVPKTVSDFQTEGHALKNCLGTMNYDGRMANGQEIILFVRKATDSSRPFVAVSFDIVRRLVLQCYAENNRRPSDDVLSFVNGCLAQRAATVAEKNKTLFARLRKCAS